MDNLTNKIEEILKNTSADESEFIKKYLEATEGLVKMGLSEKPSYTLPLTDTIGKQTYYYLNKK